VSEPLRLTAGEKAAWLKRLASDVAFCDRTMLAIYESDAGSLTVDAAVSRAVYVVVDPDDFVQYVGMVDRTVGMVADRFRDHHKYSETWDRVWVIALGSWLSHQEVRLIEDDLIHYYDPPDNDVNSIAEASSLGRVS
jgi:hypothetical protein